MRGFVPQLSLSRLAAGVACVVLCDWSRCLADIAVPGANGADGAFSATASRVVHLENASAGSWDGAPATPGNGVYDSEKWAVVYKYSSVVIGTGAAVTFTNHPSHAPVVWLVSGNVQIDGTLSLQAPDCPGANGTVGEPGPGGFRGGAGCIADPGVPGSGGFGPGGGGHGDVWCGALGTGACYADAGWSADPANRYGSQTIIPLIGGSGASKAYAFFTQYGGSGGGGAILIAATGTITVNGAIIANGGNCGGAGGAGGAIRLVANAVAGGGQLRAVGNNVSRFGSAGRIRLEVATTNSITNSNPIFTVNTVPISTATLWPAANAGSARILSIGGLVLPEDPYARLGSPFVADRYVPWVGAAPLVVETRNMNPANTLVRLRAVALNGADRWLTIPFLSGNSSSALWSLPVAFGSQFTVIQATAANTLPVLQSPNVFSREVSVFRNQCAADLDDGSGSGMPDGALTIDDLIFMLISFEAGSTACDVDDGTRTGSPDGAVTIDDLLFFLARFEAGC